MRAPRIAILVLFIAASLFILCRSLSTTRTSTSSNPAKPRSAKSVLGFMYYNTPFSLFPPNAAIGLTDDNSTLFAARPAAFGPKLASKGLSGQLWVGKGFPDDGRDGEGELGCGDLLGWETGNIRSSLKNSFKTAGLGGATSQGSPDHSKRSKALLDRDHRDALTKSKTSSRLSDGDDTDDHLYPGLDSAHSQVEPATSFAHADIQSMQEAAEIEGKVVLLMRGECGFLDKVMWAQRRGAIAVIVGDNQKGGPLIQMFAHGDDVENVTIPSVFTARTTAHLLSSLTQPGSFIEDIIDYNGNSVVRVQHNSRTHRNAVKKDEDETDTAPHVSHLPKRSWLSRLFDRDGSTRYMNVDADGRPPSSGRHDRMAVEGGKDDDAVKNGSKDGSLEPKITSDDFVIGVQDWRDPDLVNKGPMSGDQREPGKASSGSAANPKGPKQEMSDAHGAKGGSTTLGSGEYRSSEGASKSAFTEDEGSEHAVNGDSDRDDHGRPISSPASDEPHEGLWVTITPTSSANSFFDTLLVLVISPLITLTVVYSLLIIRARIRRRRWRAPKSVVDRLPVRTYHTVARSPSLSPSPTPRAPSPTPTTPLLQQTPIGPRPRSRTTTGVIESDDFTGPSSPIPTSHAPSRERARNEHEKGSSGFSAEWRKYMGRQVECVVCLEEYVDGVSKVMSLPCGHEFHVDCITPWLTTRRRTCPICKGDVVRSLARGTSSGPRYEPYRDDSDDDLDAEPSGSHAHDHEDDPEQGISSESQGRSFDRHHGWLGLFSGGRSPRPRPTSPGPAERE
ncbi:hypothetical protein S40288_03422 [Stachybotrys chartarum IBT 40288]|nr:hypothetical protein S40288_03422 [Stachybotrys chartarum IBT 40288]